MSSSKRDRKVQPKSGTKFPVTEPGNGRVPAFSYAKEIAHALHRAYGGTHAAVKTVAALTGANERAVKNWFQAQNGPNGRHLVELVRHSDEALDAFLHMAGRESVLAAKRLVDARNKLEEMLALIVELQGD